MTAFATTARATIVMYHYVRRRDGHPFPRLASLDLDAFRGQLDYIRRHYTPVSILEIAAAAHGDGDLPPRPIALTFDDGYVEHYREVVPLLRKARIEGAFFPAASSLIDRRMLDVNRIQFVLAAAENPDVLADAVDRAVARDAGRSDVKSVEDYRADGWKAGRYDSAAASYVKYMLQGALPEDIRARILDELFAAFVSRDERGFADDLYFSVDQAREMAELGMTIGCHADRHLALTTLDAAGQAREIDGALRALDAIGQPRSPFVFSYAKGSHNHTSVTLLRERGCVLAVTNRPSFALLAPDTVLRLPRLDANDLPVEGKAPPNDWTRRA